MNSVTLVGSLGKDPELKSIKGGNSICEFSLATNDGYGDHKKTNWHNIVCFGKTAENAPKYIKKGSKVGLQGEIEYQSWDGQDGQKKYKTVIKVNKLEFLDSKSDGNKQEQVPQQRKSIESPQPTFDAPPHPNMPIDDDLPF